MRARSGHEIPLHGSRMKGARWIVIGTRTDGLPPPVHVVELCGQRMNGWEPVGRPFGMLLNHGVPISAEFARGA